MEGHDDERAVELSATQAIFPELVIDHRDHLAASLSIPISPVESLPVVFSLPDGAVPQQKHLCLLLTADGPASGQDIQYISHLPPLQLKVHIPLQYPVGLPPQVQLESESS